MEDKNQKVENLAVVERQVNINQLDGNVEFYQRSRLAARFKRLKEEVEKDIRYDKFIDDIKRYNTVLDGKDMPTKLADAGFTKGEIAKATKRKHAYSKKLEKNILYETAQLIDLELFALIRLNFETYIEPLIEQNATKTELKVAVNTRIVEPIIELINRNGSDDIFLNYTSEDILGMIYFLTGKCHLNWIDYDNV